MTIEQDLLRPGAAVISASATRIRETATKAVAAVHSGTWIEVALLAVVFSAILGIRAALAGWQSADYIYFLRPWSAYLQEHGFLGLGDQFADYNVPYLYLLFIGTLLPVKALAWIKLIGFASDIALALGAAAILRSFSVPKHIAVLGSTAVLLLPEVLLNSAAWGQADSTYSAFVVWAVWAALRSRSTTAWVCFALAFTLKLQAAFLLPVIGIAHVSKRWGWKAPLIGVAVALLTEVPALIAGRSPLSLIQVYFNQTNTYQNLDLNAPSIFAFMPDALFRFGRPAGMCFAIAIVALVSYIVLRFARRREVPNRTLALFAATLGLLAPYTLPQMHERYFYLGNALLFILAMVDRKLLPLAFAGQAIAVIAYAPFLFQTQIPLPMTWLTLAEGAIVLFLIVRLFRECGVTLTDAQLVDHPVVR